MSSNDVCRIHSGYSNTTTKPKKVKYVKTISNSVDRKSSAGYEDNEYDAIHDNSYFVNPIPSDDLYLGPDDHELLYDDEYPNSDDSKSAAIIENHRINAANKSLQHVSYYPHNSVATDSTCTQSSNGRCLTAELCVPCLPPVKAAAAVALPNHPAKYSSTLLHTIPRNELSCGSFIERLPPGESDAFEALFSNYRSGAGSEGNRINGGSNISETTSSIGNQVQRIIQDEAHMQRREEMEHHGLHQSSSLNDVLQALDRIGKPQYFDTCLGSGSGLRRANVPLAVTYSPYRHMGGTIFNNVGHNYQDYDGHTKGKEQRHTSPSNSFPYSSFIQMPLPSLLPASSLLTSLSDNNCYKINRAADNDVGKTLLRQTSQTSCTSTSSSSSTSTTTSTSSSTSSGTSSSSSVSSSTSAESGLEGRVTDSDHYHLKGNICNDIRLEKFFDGGRLNALERFSSVPSQICTSTSQSATMPKIQGFSGEAFPLLRGTETSSRLDASISLGYDKCGDVNSFSIPYTAENNFHGCVNSEADVFCSRSGADISSKSDSSSHSSYSHSNSNNNSIKSLTALRTVSRKGMSREDMGFSEAVLSSPPAVCIEERPRIFAHHGSVSPSSISQPLNLSHLPPMRSLQESTRNGSTEKRNITSQLGSPGAIVGHGHGHNPSNWNSKEEFDGSVRRDSIDMMDSSFAADILLAYAAQTHGPYIDTLSEIKINRSQPSDGHFRRDSNGQQDAETKRNFDTVRTIMSIGEEHGFGHYARNGVLDQSTLSSRQSSTGSAHNTRKRIRGDGVGEEVGV